MSNDFTTNVARIIVGGLAAAVVSKVLGPKAGIVGAVLVVVAHEAFDAPVATALRKAGTA